jgi:hypothetical protein
VVGNSVVSNVLDQRVVRNGVYLHGLLYHPVEQLSARSRGPSVKPKSELVEVVIKMLMTYSTMEGACQPTFSAAPRHDGREAGVRTLALSASRGW